MDHLALGEKRHYNQFCFLLNRRSIVNNYFFIHIVEHTAYDYFSILWIDIYLFSYVLT